MAAVRALVIRETGLRLEDVPDPTPRPGEVVVAVDACGVCGSDLHRLHAPAAFVGHILGHEAAGEIVAAGADVDPSVVGRRVAINPVGSCGQCVPCRVGVPYRCETVPNIGLTAPGGLAEYVAVPQAQAYPLPDDVPFELGARAEPLAVSLAGVEKAAPEPGHRVAVYGVGPIGLHALVLLRHMGVDDLVALGRSEPRRRAADAFAPCLDSRETTLAEHAAATGWVPDTVIECTGSADAIDDAIQSLRVGGRLIALGLPETRIDTDFRRIASRGLDVHGVCSVTPAQFQRSVGLLAALSGPLTALTSHQADFAGATELIDRMLTGGEVIGALVRPAA